MIRLIFGFWQVMDSRIILVLENIRKREFYAANISELAQSVGISVYYLHRLFKYEMGISLKKYIDDHKMDRAFRMLMEEMSSVLDVALELGYNDYATFSRTFKRYFKVNPEILKVARNKIDLKLKDASDLQQHEKIVKVVVVVPTKDQKEIETQIREQLLKLDLADRENTPVKTFILDSTKDEIPKDAELIKKKYVFEEGCSDWEEKIKKILAEKYGL